MRIRHPAVKFYLDFLWAMTEKEIKARYKKAVFGFLWVILNPLLQMLIIGAIFSFFVEIPNYFLFLFTGLLGWQFFSLSLSKATPSIVYERNLLKKARFPIEAIPISIVLANFIHILVSLLLLVVFLVLSEELILVNFILIIPTLIWLAAVTVGLSLITSSLNVRFRDINFFVQALLILWFYATPILYSLSLIPKNLHGLYFLNPLTTIFELVHLSLLNEGALDMSMLIVNLLESLGIIFLGVMVYLRQYKTLVDWL